MRLVSCKEADCRHGLWAAVFRFVVIIYICIVDTSTCAAVMIQMSTQLDIIPASSQSPILLCETPMKPCPSMLKASSDRLAHRHSTTMSHELVSRGNVHRQQVVQSPRTLEGFRSWHNWCLYVWEGLCKADMSQQLPYRTFAASSTTAGAIHTLSNFN